MSLDLNRRELLLAGAAAWLGAGSMARAMAPQPKGATKKLLFFTKSSGIPASRDRPRRRQAVPRREDPFRHRQRAWFRGRRIQGRADVRARPDRPVGRFRF